MNLPINLSGVEKAPRKPRLSAGVAAAAALAGEPEALADWLVSSLKSKAIKMTNGNERLANKLVREMLAGVNLTVEFV